MQRIEPNIMVDVGHNPLAAKALVDIIDFDTILIYNSLDDKDIQQVLYIFAPKIKKIQYLPIECDRAAKKDEIYANAKQAGLQCEDFDYIDKKESYLVFGSFFTVRAFLHQRQAGR